MRGPGGLAGGGSEGPGGDVRRWGPGRDLLQRNGGPTAPVPRDALEGGKVPPPAFQGAQPMCPTTVSLTASASFNLTDSNRCGNLLQPPA